LLGVQIRYKNALLFKNNPPNWQKRGVGKSTMGEVYLLSRITNKATPWALLRLTRKAKKSEPSPLKDHPVAPK
jgi:hypothetical protein